MNTIPEKVKNCTEDVLKKLENVTFKRRHSPENSVMKKTKLSLRSRWGEPLIENIPYISNKSCKNCETLENKLCEATSLLNRNHLMIEDLKNKLFQSEELRKMLHCQVQEMKGPIKILCRVKPCENKCIEFPELNLNSKLQTISISKGLVKNNFFFDRVFTETASQEEIFNELEPFIQTAIDGGKVCIFSYGQTGSGKTYTLEGNNYSNNATEHSGVLPRAAIKIFAEIMRQNLSALKVCISCIEVYLDSVTDLLLNPDSKNNNPKKNLESFTWVVVENVNELLGVICNASQKRTTRGTHLNINSSRSHTIYQIKIEGISQNRSEIQGKLSVIDLAGSEKANSETFTDKSPEEIENMKKIHEEGKFINKSLSCLKRVFESLLNKNAGSLPPYRECKLTRLLQDQLSSGEVAVIVTISPDNYVESKESLKFGSTVQMAKV